MRFNNKIPLSKSHKVYENDFCIKKVSLYDCKILTDGKNKAYQLLFPLINFLLFILSQETIFHPYPFIMT